ncbi:MAG: AmmeMemoRadiSam system protein B [Thermoanaerobaculia bacterium]
MRRVRPPAVAGTFYPAEPEALARAASRLLADEASAPRSQRPPRAIVAPHAGWQYSGHLAARAFAPLAPHRAAIRRVLLLGPCHFVPLRGLALPEVSAFATPLGEVAIDPAAERLLTLRQVTRRDVPHAEEHALEVELPFLQTVLGPFHLIPLVVGEATPDEVAEVIASVPAEQTLVVVSTDLSHYLPQAVARRRDDGTAAAVERLDWRAIGTAAACGAVPLRGLLRWAAERAPTVRRLGLATSADVGSPVERVVGYGAWVFDDLADISDV